MVGPGVVEKMNTTTGNKISRRIETPFKYLSADGIC
jgi:hypothetical protein